MTVLKISAALVVAQMVMGVPAFAQSPCGVTDADITRLESSVSKMKDKELKSKAENLVTQAKNSMKDGEYCQSFNAIEQTRSLVQQDQQKG